jgi:hypothetical protein
MGYNIGANFFVNEKYVITGSENGYVFIYDANTAEIVN